MQYIISLAEVMRPEPVRVQTGEEDCQALHHILGSKYSDQLSVHIQELDCQYLHHLLPEGSTACLLTDTRDETPLTQ
jgi:hypothetical protein